MHRVAVVGGVRTPFVKAGGVFADDHFLDLGIHVLKNAVQRLDLEPLDIDELIFGTVLLDPRLPNFAREMVIRSGLPKVLSAHSVSNNCISGLVAINMVAEGIKSGRLKIGLAGGAESMSRPTLTLTSKAEKKFLKLARSRNFADRFSSICKFRPGDFMPQPPSPREPSTGLTMGEHCELTAKEFDIAREIQDEIALKSHLNAAAAQQSGILNLDIVPHRNVAADNIVRPDTSLDKLIKLKPVFDRSAQGTLTAGNSSPLTDGASIVCLMSEEEAKRRGRQILGFLDGVAYAAIAPEDGLLMAPGIAIPKLFHREQIKVDSIDLFEVHEAFAAQVAANLMVWEKGWKKFPNIKPIGKIPAEKINVHGGSIAIGHPFAATGGRLVLGALRALEERKQNKAVISVCAAGAMACAMLVSRS